MAVSVDIYVQDSELVPQPISSVIVNAYDGITLALVASATTDGNGQAALLLPGSVSGTTYELRFFKSGVLFTNPQAISVLEPGTNAFDATGTLTTLPVSSNPRMCRCTGQFINFSGAGVPNTLVRVTAILGAGSLTSPPTAPIPPPIVAPPPLPPNLLSGFQVPKVVDGKMVSIDTMEFKTDSNGKVSFDLLRGGQYYVSFAGEEDVIWAICVPDRSSANLINLIHPEPVSLTWNQTDAPGDAVFLAVGETKTVRFTALFSNFITYASNLSNILQFTNSDGSLFELVYDSGVGRLSIRGIAAGTAQATVSVLPNLTPARLPAYSITAVPLEVTVTP